MVWFKVDDKLHSNNKIRKVVADDPAALALWLLAGSWCGDSTNDGFVPDHQLPWLMPARGDELAQKLVAARLWRRVRGGYQFHDWLDWQPSKESVETTRKRNARRQALVRDPVLREVVRTRDHGLCRYCGIKVKWSDRRSGEGGTYDHVDPDGPNTAENLVVSCRSCNSSKCDKTLAESGMTLLPPGTTAADVSKYGPGKNLDSVSPPTRPPLKGEEEGAPASPGGSRPPNQPSPPRPSVQEPVDLDAVRQQLQAASAKHRARANGHAGAFQRLTDYAEPTGETA